MAKKIILPIYLISVVGVILLLVFNNIDYFTTTTIRLKELLSPFELENFFDIYNKNNNRDNKNIYSGNTGK